jgi:uncharacterized protein (DUF1697 family)
MPVLISMLRGVNVGAHNRIKMDDLRAVYTSLKLENPQTYVQSGNIIFRTKEKNLPQLSKKIQDAFEKKFKFRPDVILRTVDEFRSAIDASPFADRPDLEAGKILVSFLAAPPPKEVHAAFDRFRDYPEQVHLKGSELYIYFPNGAGKSKLPWSSLEKLLKVTGTARNLNSVTKILEMAEEMEKS